jgi:Putative prokaryotic signal transducing protein
MDEHWELIYQCSAAYKAEILKAVLEENEIPCVVVNKKDSSYLFGEIELYVKQDDVLNAKQIINRFEANE